jgi:hypothetical protein
VNDAAADDRWVTGDHFGLPIPADPAALCDGGTAFLMVLARRRQRLALRPAGLGLRRPDEYRHGAVGAMSGAETDMWERHLDDLLGLFVSEIHACGDPDLDVAELHHQLMLYVGIMAVAWLLDVLALMRSRFGDSARSLSRNDPNIKDDESVRAPLQMLTNALNLWIQRNSAIFSMPRSAELADYCHDGLAVNTSDPLSVMTTVSRCSTAPRPSCHT